jgi:hypothetical protein
VPPQTTISRRMRRRPRLGRRPTGWRQRSPDLQNALSARPDAGQQLTHPCHPPLAVCSFNLLYPRHSAVWTVARCTAEPACGDAERRPYKVENDTEAPNYDAHEPGRQRAIENSRRMLPGALGERDVEAWLFGASDRGDCLRTLPSAFSNLVNRVENTQFLTMPMSATCAVGSQPQPCVK